MGNVHFGQGYKQNEKCETEEKIAKFTLIMSS